MNPSEIDISSTADIYSVANTPQFLIRKLRSEECVRDVVTKCKGLEIIEALRASIQIEPQTTLDAVRPYVLLVALSMLRDARYLEEARGLVPIGHYDWYRYITGYLCKTFSVVQIESVQVPGSLPRLIVSTDVDAAINRQTISVRR